MTIKNPPQTGKRLRRLANTSTSVCRNMVIIISSGYFVVELADVALRTEQRFFVDRIIVHVRCTAPIHYTTRQSRIESRLNSLR